MKEIAAPLLALVLAAGAASCGGDDDDADGGSAPRTTTTTTTTATTGGRGAKDAAGTTGRGRAPERSADREKRVADPERRHPEERDRLTGRDLRGYLRRASPRAAGGWRYSQIVAVEVDRRRVEIAIRLRPGRAAAESARGICAAVRRFFDDRPELGPPKSVAVVEAAARSSTRRC